MIIKLAEHHGFNERAIDELQRWLCKPSVTMDDIKELSKEWGGFVAIMGYDRDCDAILIGHPNSC